MSISRIRRSSCSSWKFILLCLFHQNNSLFVISNDWICAHVLLLLAIGVLVLTWWSCSLWRIWIDAETARFATRTARNIRCFPQRKILLFEISEQCVGAQVLLLNALLGGVDIFASNCSRCFHRDWDWSLGCVHFVWVFAKTTGLATVTETYWLLKFRYGKLTIWYQSRTDRHRSPCSSDSIQEFLCRHSLFLEKVSRLGRVHRFSYSNWKWN